MFCCVEKKKQKLLHGGHCNEELAILSTEIRRHGALPSLSRIRELSNPCTYLCRHCQTLLLQKKKLEDELEDRTKKIDLKLGLLTARNRENNRKRTLTEEEEVIEDKVIVSYY